MMNSIGYKKAQDNRIIVLEIIGATNETRLGIVDKNCAMFRTSRARVLDIYDMFDKRIKCGTALSMRDDSFHYTVGQIVEPDSFDPNMSNVHGPGIHYFLTEGVALHYGSDPENGVYREWHENGGLWMDYKYKNGVLDGRCDVWDIYGQISKRTDFKNGEPKYLYDSLNDADRNNQSNRNKECELPGYRAIVNNNDLPGRRDALVPIEQPNLPDLRYIRPREPLNEGYRNQDRNQDTRRARCEIM
jgi:hypothetical protein